MKRIRKKKKPTSWREYSREEEPKNPRITDK
jgi:hypothetical protein